MADAREMAVARAIDQPGRDDRLSVIASVAGTSSSVRHSPPCGANIGWSDLATMVLLGVVHGIASLVAFESKGGSAVPTAPIFVASLFLLPLSLVPTVVLIGLLIGARGTGRGAVRRVLVPALSGWNSIGPVLVLSQLHEPPSIDLWYWYLLVFAAELALMCSWPSCASVRSACRGGCSPAPMAWTYAIDSMLAPIGLTAVIATQGSLWAVLWASTPIGVLALLARDRAEHLEQAVAISEAFEAAIETARLDALTGIGNRRAWNEATARAAVEFAADPFQSTITVVMGDLDRLKTVNDTFGHDAGDDLIKAAAWVFLDAAPPACSWLASAATSSASSSSGPRSTRPDS